MPIFHDHFDSPPRKSVAQESAPDQLERAGYPQCSSEATLRDGVDPGSCTESNSRFNIDSTPFNTHRKPSVLNRVELIERIKRGNSPSWPQLQNNGKHSDAKESRPTSRDRPSTPLLPPAELKPSRTTTPDPLRDHASAGFEIERPRSALHSGDFREKKEDPKFDNGSSNIPLATSPVPPWHSSFPAAAYPSSRGQSVLPFADALNYDSRPTIRSRTASQSSFSSSFVFMPPTSPLVQQSNNTDLDFSSRPASRQSSRSPERNNRRHTYSPHSFQTFKSAHMAKPVFGTPGARHLRREGTFPYQAHQPRRSMTSFHQFQPHSSPQTPFMHPQRPACSSDASPLHHAPMVGSYEESILRGRMSTTPSRPLDFVAQIGVLGKGQCKPNLRCPPHVTVPFPAVFYSYNSGNGRIADNSPSPYVGLVDLENSLSPPEESSESSRRKRRHTIPTPAQDELDFQPSPRDDHHSRLSKGDIRRREKMKRRSTSPKAPPGGSYRIPQQGQLQIVLKNPNKTAVKLFLVPYDLSDMEPGQKTFIRQRSYSAGPIIDMPLSSRKNFGTDRPEAALSNSDDPNDRPVLRYLIHLHICSPSKGRYFLYKSIRVVFANRVPDGKEKLRNEIQLPEPRYSTYKPTRDSLAQQSSSSTAAQLTAEKAYRRRSLAFSLSQHSYDHMDGLSSQPPLPSPTYRFCGGNGFPSHDFGSPMSAVEPIPFNLPRVSSMDSQSVSQDPLDLNQDSPFRTHTSSGTNPSPSRASLSTPMNIHTETFDKLSKGDIGYGGNAFCSIGGPAASPGAGLLARRLRGLDVQPDKEEQADAL
ncbi:uncharacterized protein BDR25DRAFT_302507 [Lindgomyces ingoldianus]|uniref:Uncharacterized protein n=1 Tax=Lindgomyces ingoldianus TaxID=673940 RepID=A0ACB6R298_9PLEO|nr:uncharacterized protein BDR25DRAFT_302507 [Lindgomyces ingoldianus]KAF2472915.1 hypothetical protein BDR25DRAFT_302507 [Lindgomyces ingoldianus]